jgi:hypothetical protein
MSRMRDTGHRRGPCAQSAIGSMLELVIGPNRPLACRGIGDHSRKDPMAKSQVQHWHGHGQGQGQGQGGGGGGVDQAQVQAVSVVKVKVVDKVQELCVDMMQEAEVESTTITPTIRPRPAAGQPRPGRRGRVQHGARLLPGTAPGLQEYHLSQLKRLTGSHNHPPEYGQRRAARILLDAVVTGYGRESSAYYLAHQYQWERYSVAKHTVADLYRSCVPSIGSSSVSHSVIWNHINRVRTSGVQALVALSA